MKNPTVPSACLHFTPMSVEADGVAPVIWLTGLSGAGKTTLATGLRCDLAQHGIGVVVLDGDAIRDGLSRGLGFTQEERAENIRRIAEVARLLSLQGLVVIVAAVSPLRTQRALARRIVGRPYREVHVSAPLQVCERRDVKGLYARARRGEVRQFTGVSDAYEAPLSADLKVDTDDCSVREGVDSLWCALTGRWMPSLLGDMRA